MIHLALIALALLAVAFAAVWAVCVRLDNYGYLDVVWSLSIAMLAPLYALIGTGASEREWAFAIVGAVWSLRLGVYIFLRVTRALPREDKRYQTLRRKWPGRWRFLLFFELQAAIAVMFSLPFLIACLNDRPGLNGWEIAGLLIAAGATAGEALADWQAQHFKRRSRPASPVIDAGLWRYSRHPNYFFESVVWWGFFIAALGSPWGWVTVVCPLMMLYLLLGVTGIPLTEKHSLESHGEAYRRYQRTTSPFVPWFRGKEV